jgi:hypothetical protein
MTARGGEADSLSTVHKRRKCQEMEKLIAYLLSTKRDDSRRGRGQLAPYLLSPRDVARRFRS